MAWTQSDLDAIEKAIANGTTKVDFGDRSVTYRSLNQLNRVRQMMMAELGKARAPRRKWPAFGKGFKSESS